jgi:hypothetical protein
METTKLDKSAQALVTQYMTKEALLGKNDMHVFNFSLFNNLDKKQQKRHNYPDTPNSSANFSFISAQLFVS